MAKATMTIRQALHYPPQYAAYFAANQILFNRVVAFYFDCIQAHEDILALTNKEALTALEHLTQATGANPHPIMPLTDLVPDIPAYFRRAAINAALGSARAFSSSLKKWRARKEKHGAKAASKGKKKPWRERPPVPPRSWNKSVPFYADQWKERRAHSILLKVWTGTCWSWLKVHTLSRALPDGFTMGSPSLVRKESQWWLHTPIEKTFAAPAKVEQQVTSNPQTKICAVDLNLDMHLAVCSVQTVDGTILATSFIGNGTAIAGCRKQLLGRIARNRSHTGIIAENEQDNADLWRKIRHVDEQIAHLVSARIVQFAQRHGASLLVFEHLGKLRPEKGRYSRRGNTKRAYWMKGRIFRYSKYKAWNQGIITCRVNPANTSRECHRCHAHVIRYQAGQPQEGYTPGAALCICPQCQYRCHADRNASIRIGQRLIERTQEPLKEKPHALARRAQRESKGSGVGIPHDAKRHHRPSTDAARRGDHANGHGTAQENRRRMGAPLSVTSHPLRLPFE